MKFSHRMFLTGINSPSSRLPLLDLLLPILLMLYRGVSMGLHPLPGPSHLLFLHGIRIHQKVMYTLVEGHWGTHLTKGEGLSHLVGRVFQVSQKDYQMNSLSCCRLFFYNSLLTPSLSSGHINLYLAPFQLLQHSQSLLVSVPSKNSPLKYSWGSTLSPCLIGLKFVRVSMASLTKLLLPLEMY